MSEDTSIIDEVVNRARIAQQHYEEIGSQQLFDDEQDPKKRVKAFIDNKDQLK